MDTFCPIINGDQLRSGSWVQQRLLSPAPCHGYKRKRKTDRCRPSVSGLLGHAQLRFYVAEPCHSRITYILARVVEQSSSDPVSFTRLLPFRLLELISPSFIPSNRTLYLSLLLHSTCSSVLLLSWSSSSALCSFKPVSGPLVDSQPFGSNARPLTAPTSAAKRQIGDLQCNINRLQIVSDIAQMQGTVKTLASQVS